MRDNDDAKIERLLNRLAWHLGFWKSYGTRDTAERAQAALNLISQITAMGKYGRWGSIRGIIIHAFQSINGMALRLDSSRLNPLLLREVYGQMEADLKVIRLQFRARATREQ